MPLYDYRCNSCGYTFEEVLTIEQRHDPLKNPCPKCAALNIKKEIYQVNTVRDIAINAGKKIDPGLRSTLDKMKASNPNMTWNLGA